MKLITESIFNNLETIIEQKNPNAPKTIKFRGPYIVTEIKNQNGRTYSKGLMEKVIFGENGFNSRMIESGRALGELSHPQTTEINLENVCHKIDKLVQQDNVFVGESTVLTGTPKGDILAGLLTHNAKIGISSRGVGSISENNMVDEEYNLVTCDIVADPSGLTKNGSALWVDGILESKSYMVDSHGDIIEQAYNKFEKSINTLGRNKDITIINAINNFLKGI